MDALILHEEVKKQFTKSCGKIASFLSSNLLVLHFFISKSLSACYL